MNICVFGPHPDDQELGMGGTVRLLAERGHRVLLVDVTDGEPTPLGSHETRRAEAAAALEVLNEGLDALPGAHPVQRLLLGQRAGFTNRVVEHSVPARHAVAAVMRAWQADVVFVTYPEDAHPDHRAVTRIVEDARFDAKLSKLPLARPVDLWTGDPLKGPTAEALPETLGERTVYPKWLFYYYATHLRWVPDPSFVLDITGRVDLKLRAIRAYATQFVMPEKNRRVVDWVAASATYFGSRIGVDAGEAFHTKEPVGLIGLEGLAGF